MFYRDVQFFVDATGFGPASDLVDLLNGESDVLRNLNLLTRMGTVASRGVDKDAYKSQVLSTAGKSVPFGGIRWFEDEACFVCAFKGNPRLGIVLYDLKSLLPSTSAREVVTENLLKVLGGGIVTDWPASDQTAVNFSKHPLFLILLGKYHDEVKQTGSGQDINKIMRFLVTAPDSVVYSFAKYRIDLYLNPENSENKIFSSTFSILPDSPIVSGSKTDDLIKKAYDVTKKIWGKKSLLGSGYEAKSLSTITSSQYSASYDLDYPANISESEFHGRVITDILDGIPEAFSITDPESLAELYEKKAGTSVDIWEMHKQIMADTFNNIDKVGSSSLQRLVGKAGIERMKSKQLFLLIQKVEESKKILVNVGDAKIIKYLDVMIRILLINGSKV
jgi:hypothetical protein